MLSALVLAAGTSQRMGTQNKLLLPYRDTTILAWTVGNLLAAGLEEVIVVTGHEEAAVRETIAGLPIHIVYNPAYATGMTSSIREGVRRARGSGYMICLSDMVLITPEEYAFLKKAFEIRYEQDSRCICVPEYQGQKGNPVLFSSFYREAILEHTPPEGCKEIVRSHPEHIHRIEMPTDHVLKDIDHPEDYRAL
jgi:molybdenum cofactor cytidylyltransferase